MRSLLCPSLALLLLAPAMAQRSLTQLQQEFATAAQQLGEHRPTREQQAELWGKQIAELGKFLAEEAKGDDRWNGRVMLADLQLVAGKRDDASKTLASIDKAEAPAMVLITAATMAQHLGLRELRDGWIDVAVTKEAPLDDRMAMARLLMSVLHEVKKGEALFDAALAAAKDDEERAMVRWHRADGLRDREDLGDDAGLAELEKLAKELPNTYWGSVAKDRLRASSLQIGDDAIPFRAKTRSGEEVSLAALRGRTVALVFWSAADPDLPGLVTLLQDLKKQRGDALSIIGVAIDYDQATIDAAIKDLGIKFPVIGDGKGIATDPALRWNIGVPVVDVIDANGKVIALGQHAGTKDAREQLTEALTRPPK